MSASAVCKSARAWASVMVREDAPASAASGLVAASVVVAGAAGLVAGGAPGVASAEPAKDSHRRRWVLAGEH